MAINTPMWLNQPNDAGNLGSFSPMRVANAGVPAYRPPPPRLPMFAQSPNPMAPPASAPGGGMMPPAGMGSYNPLTANSTMPPGTSGGPVAPSPMPASASFLGSLFGGGNPAATGMSAMLDRARMNPNQAGRI